MIFKNEKIIGALEALLALLGIYFVIVFATWFIYAGRLQPGTYIAGERLSGKTEDQAIKILKGKTGQLTEIKLGGTTEKTSEIGLVFDLEKTVKKAIAEGQENPFSLTSKKEFPVLVTFNQKKFYQLLKAQEASQKIAVNNPVGKIENSKVIFRGGNQGVRLNYGQTTQNLIGSLGGLNKEVLLDFYSVAPALAGQLDSTLVPTDLELVWDGGQATVPAEKVASWFKSPSKEKSYVQLFEGSDNFLPFLQTESSRFNEQLIEQYLSELAGRIDVKPQNARLSAAGGKIEVTEREKQGRTLNIPESLSRIADSLEAQDGVAKLVVESKEAEIRTANLGELGLKELVSTGYSNFSGSPANRVHNVRTGASKFNGVIIRPGEVFSFNTILGPVDASTGYRPELVILENKTQPQFGGGLCQVSSTAFRAALNAGFPILERKAHAYPVSYYRPYGVDATIYLPSPDFRFRNDSGGHLLVQTRIVGKNLYFDFYGTKEARRVAFAGNKQAQGAVPIVEKVSPYIFDRNKRGSRSLSAIFYRFIYDESGKLINSRYFLSRYDSPDKYPH